MRQHLCNIGMQLQNYRGHSPAKVGRTLTRLALFSEVLFPSLINNKIACDTRQG